MLALLVLSAKNGTMHMSDVFGGSPVKGRKATPTFFSPSVTTYNWPACSQLG